MFNLKRTIELVTGALLDSEATWRSYLPEAGDWKQTAILLTGPLIIASAVVAYLLGLVTADGGMLGAFRPTILSTVFTIIMGAIGAGAVAFVFSALSGTFGGKSDFALGLAAATLAFVPGYIGQALAWLPWIGGLLAIGLGIFSLVQLWKIIPTYLEVPESKRAIHYAVSLIATIVVMMIMSRVLAPIAPGPQFSSGVDASGNASSGVFADVNRRAAIVAEAQEDTYTPPSDGMLTDDQVRYYASVMQRVAEMQAATMKRMEELAEKADEDDQLSAGDFGAMMSGMTEIGGLGTAAIEIVKEDGGNWAEHQWVQQTLLSASYEKDTNDVVAHNYDLYRKYEDQLRPAVDQ